MSIRHLTWVALLLATLPFIGLWPTSARIWKASPEELARDYSTINDSRANGEIAMLMWFAPPIVRSDTSGAATTKALLEKYVVMMVLHGQLDKTTGVLSFDDIAALEAKDQNGRPLNRIASADLTPTTSALLAAMETMLRQSLGALGKGIRVFVFDAGAVKSCEKGKISVPFAGDTYTWQTPIPGCSR